MSEATSTESGRHHLKGQGHEKIFGDLHGVNGVGTIQTVEALNEAERKKRQHSGMEAWMRWGKQHAKSIVEVGGPLGKTKRADAGGVSDTKNLMSGYVVVEAESHEAAAQMFANHPHFSIFPGESVEIMECLPMPKM